MGAEPPKPLVIVDYVTLSALAEWDSLHATCRGQPARQDDRRQRVGLEGAEMGSWGAEQAGAVRAVACVEAGAPGDTEVAAARGDPLLGRVTAAVRADDRVCPVFRGTVVVELGTDPGDVTPFELAERLARASSQPLSPTGIAEQWVAVGLAVGSDRDDPRRLNRAALGAHRSSRTQLEGALAASTSHVLSVITIDTMHDDGPNGVGATGRLFPRRRRAHRFSAGRLSWGSARPAQPRGEPAAGGCGRSRTLVVVDPRPVTPRVAGLAAATAASVAEGIGYRSLAVACEDNEWLPLELEGATVDVAVIVLDGCRGGEFLTRPPERPVPAEITRWYRSAGATVLALSAGAGAATLASCTAEGAVPVFNMERFPDLLRRIASTDRTSDPSATPVGLPDIGLSLPPRFQALVDLTPSERRVLCYMTGGWAAQEIADDLVVSLTTVRSHIRSILRRLGVRSQLAAVAIANSRELFEEFDAAQRARLEAGNRRPRPPFPLTNDSARSA